MTVQGGVAAPRTRAAAGLGRAGLDRELATARARLARRLRQVDPAALGLSAYNQRYLGHKVAAIESELLQVSDLLRPALAGSPLPLDALTVLDYGGGSGVISLLAKEAGIGTVVYNDIYDVSCADASRLGEAVGLPLDHVVCGDVDDVVAALRERSLRLNAVVSYDVLEHVYDIPAFFRTLASAPVDEAWFRVVLASGANIRNPRYVRHATRVHRRNELEGSEPEWGHKERDATRPFLELRRELIRDAAPQLAAAQVEELARATRGLRRDDLERAVAEYVEVGAISYRPDHPTNTCDPYTGNWSEHLMEPAWLERVAREAGFDVRVGAGRYAPVGADARTAAKRLLNVGIAALGARALPVAPYYVVHGTLPTRNRNAG